MVQTGFFLHDSVGPGRRPANRRDDVIAVKQRLNELGLYEPPPEGFADDIDAGFDAALKRFQAENGLQVDGRLEPGGETERNLVAALSDKKPEEPVTAEKLVLNGGVGSRGANKPEDVVKVKQALNALGRLPYDRTRPPPPYIDTKTLEAIRDVQRDLGLFDDGVIGPEGETIQALRDVFTESPEGRPRTSTGETEVAAAYPLPDGETSRARRDLLYEKPRGRPGTRPGETEVAALPLAGAVPVIVRLAAPHVLRALGGSTAGATAGQVTIDAAKGTAHKGADTVAKLRMIGPSLPPIPPFPAKEDNAIQVESLPQAPSPLPTHTAFPIPDDPGMLIEIFPDQSEEFSIPFILDNSRGSEPIQILNTSIKDLVLGVASARGLNIKHIGGARENGINVKETHLGNPDGGRFGAARPDITLQNPETGRRMFINTVDTRADGETPSSREQRAAVRIIINGESGDLLLLIPKPPKGMTIDFNALEEIVTPLLKEIAKPKPKVDPREDNAPEELIRRMFRSQ